MSQPPENGRWVETVVSRKTKPPGYLDIGGHEKNVPSVKWISRFLDIGKKPFVVIGGGSSGKTESLVTALELTGKSYTVFDLQKWTVNHFAQNAIVESCLEDPDLGEEARAYLSELHDSFAHIDDDTERRKLVGKHYYTDSGIKYAEAYLLGKQLDRVKRGLEFSDGVTADPNEANTLKSLGRKKSEVVILDEIDLGIGRALSPVEQETARRLVEYVVSLPNKQVGMVLHPAAAEDTAFISSLHSELLKRHGTFFRMNMEYFPVEVQRAVLGLVEVDGQSAEDFIHDVQGLPGAYLDICTKPELQEELLSLDPHERLRKLRAMAEFTVEDNKEVIFDKATDKVQRVLIEILNGKRFDISQMGYHNPGVIKHFPPDPRDGPRGTGDGRLSLIQNLIRTGYVYIDTDTQELVMPPVVKRVLTRLLA